MTRLCAVGLVSGWGAGVAALPADAPAAADGRRVIPVPRPALDGERFRRATRECLLGVAAVEAMLAEGELTRDAIRGADTALLYVTAAAYGASNRLFIGAGGGSPARTEGGLAETRRGSASATSGSALAEESRGGRAGTLHFPYTAPSAVPAEVAIEYGLTGGYVILVGGARATIDAIWQAARLLAARRCRRALVLTVETFAECEDLWARGRWAARGPLVEAAACALLEGDGHVGYEPADGPAPLERLAGRRAGQVLACAPLVAAALAREAGQTEARLTGEWRGRRAAVTLALPAAGTPALV
ncbi:MAG TPA: hypothetical protein VF010_05800 [Methylomirabilota bacterium]|nr:hypothetical protein [Methylomirabilota bacterium]